MDQESSLIMKSEILLACFKGVKIIVYFYVSNILEIKENYKWSCFLYNVIFNILVYIL
jgi:hypothetical protein